MSRITGIVLAAGMSRRLGRPKQLLMLGDQPVIRHVVQRALASSLDEVSVVLGAQADEVRAALHGEPVRFVVNHRFAEGQGTSLAAGVAALDAAADATADAVVVLLGDQPGIDPSVIDGVVSARRTGDASIAMAQYGAGRGHPVLFGREHFPALMALQGDEGGRQIIRAHSSDIVLVPGNSVSVPADIDTEEAWQEVSARWSGY